jgi:long-chain acyl-CoA synthetase
MIFERFRDVAREYQNRPAIIDEGQEITYGELLERTGAMRRWLQDTLSPKPGEIIAASLSNTWQFVASFFAVAELGGVLMPCNPQWRAPELRWFARRLGFRGVITEPQFRAEWDCVADVMPQQSVLTVNQAASGREMGDAWCPLQARTEDDPAVYLPTSGSTGVPRLVPRTHRNLEAGARNVARALGTGSGCRFMSVIPFFHANGFHNCMLMPLISGATLVLMKQFSAAACAELVHRERVEVFIGSPFLFTLLADSAADPRLLSTLRLCFSAGARMPAAVHERWRNHFGIRVRQWYGMSETSAISIDLTGEEPLPGAGTFVGAPIPGVEVRSLAPDGRDLGLDAVGELSVRSEAVMPGYVGEPQLNQRAFHNGFFRTGDLGYRDSSGNLCLTGRIGRVINMAGVKIDPAEIERALEALSGVSVCHVDGVSNGRDGEVIRARIVVRQGHQIARRDVLEQCRQRLAEYKLPRIIEFVESLSTTITGKIPMEWNADGPCVRLEAERKP